MIYIYEDEPIQERLLLLTLKHVGLKAKTLTGLLTLPGDAKHLICDWMGPADWTTQRDLLLTEAAARGISACIYTAMAHPNLPVNVPVLHKSARHTDLLAWLKDNIT